MSTNVARNVSQNVMINGTLYELSVRGIETVRDDNKVIELSKL